MGDPVTAFAPAKVNLDLCVTGRRPDGYHDLDSLVVFADVGDRLTLRPGEGLRLDVVGPFAATTPTAEANLVLKAARRLADRAGVAADAHLHLHKDLPVAGGIGGGSSDAAAALRGLDRLWGLGLGRYALGEIGLALGADVPVCVQARPCRVRGFGERLDPVRGLPDLPLLLVNPGLPLATGDVFAALAPDDLHPTARPGLPPQGSVAQIGVWLEGSRNDLEPPARRLAPGINAVLEALRARSGCVLARLSGSGATCFGLFLDDAARDRATARLATDHPGWWVRAASAPGGGPPT